MGRTDEIGLAAPRFRWTVVALLFAATTINYIDRQVLGLLAPALQKDIGWSESEYGYVVTAFSAAYALGLVVFGRIIDRAGTRIGFVIAISIWSLAATLHAAARSVLGFAGARFLLGLGEAGNFPAANKAVAEWFPREERAFAVGLFNCGSNVGALLTPLAVPWITLHYGWRTAFLVTGLLGFVWLIAWLALYRERPQPAQAGIPWSRLIEHRAVWAIVICRFLTDPVWWFYLYWAPKFLHSRHGLDLSQLGPPLVVIYLAADGGSILGGWLSSYWIRRGWTPNRARKLAILVCALLVTPAVFAARVTELWQAVLILSLAAAGHQGWASNMFALISDIFPARAVSSVTGICGFGGAIGGIFAASATGLLLEWTGSYHLVFLFAGTSYLLILAILHAMVPRVRPLEEISA
ncbi:MAG: MFS transporter [Bryobacter sp.]|nr:MFS transporter [Bryobacter sp.]